MNREYILWDYFTWEWVELCTTLLFIQWPCLDQQQVGEASTGGGGRTLSIVSHFQWPSSLKLREASLAAYMIVLTCEGSSQVEAAAATATAPVHILSFLNFESIL